ncbi:glycosyltransferase family 2 protein [Desemzia sp. FAM 24101]|uniref:glycosyltransferase family 2 protein n=1 Tax=unclassified Desemzia TaxID=2685243 RepID=UPI00388BA28F
MNKIPFFSVVVPVYNSERTVGKMIESMQKQTFSNFELILVNDGSTDNTEQILENYSVKDNHIIYFTIPNGGPGNARNKGIERTKGKYLLLFDADDEINSDTLGTYAALLADDSVDLIVSSYEMKIIDDNEVVSSRTISAPSETYENHGEFLKAVYPLMNQQLLYVVWNKVFRLDIIKKQAISFPPYKSCEDRLFNLRYYKHVEKCIAMDKVLYQYSFDGKNSLTNKFLFNKYDTFVEFYQELLSLTDKNQEGSSALFLKGVMSCIMPIHSKECPLDFKEKTSYIKNIVQSSVVQSAASISLTDTKIRWIMKWLFKSKSVTINYFASMMIYLISTTSPKVIEKLKSNF